LEDGDLEVRPGGAAVAQDRLGLVGVSLGVVGDDDVGGWVEAGEAT
jgi:hypothetical protein